MTAANRNNKTQVLNRFGTNTVSSFDYVYDELSRRTQRIDTRPTTPDPLVVTNDFGYNSRSELTNALMNADAFAYAYDSIGNRVDCSVGSVSQSYVANELNQYTSISNSTPPAPSSLLYDLDGNLLSYNGWTFSWNGENQLIQASNATMIVAFKYDHQGRRFEKTVNATNTTRFVYDDWAMISEISNQNSSITTNSYVYGLDLSQSLQGAGGVGGLLCVVSKAQSLEPKAFFPCYDANGNVTDYVSTNGTVVAHFEYDAFGNTTSESIAQGLMPNAFSCRFSTKYFDSETSLYYYGFRYYNPEMGRWLSRDPIGAWGGVNLYTFTVNSPYSFIDPLGKSSCNMNDANDDDLNAQTEQASTTTTTSAHDTVQKVLDQTNPKSIKERKEYCGLVCKYCSGGTWIYYTTSTSGFMGSCQPANAPCATGEQVSEWWHTQGNLEDNNGDGVDDRDGSDPNRFGDQPGESDKNWSDSTGLPGNVGTPDGSWDRYDPATGGSAVPTGTCST